MSALSRRGFIRLAGAAAVGLAGFPFIVRGAYRARVVVVGGGFGGATAAKYLRLADPAIEVTLIERNPAFSSCPGSNEVLAGVGDLDELSFGYDALAERYGVKLLFDDVTDIDPIGRRVSTAGGEERPFDRLIVAPGIDFKWGAVEGYDEAAVEAMPHAWKAGEQTALLRRQLEEMEDGGTVLIAVPPKPYRCPAAPFERASQIAHYLNEEKSESKVVILDANDAFTKREEIQAAWKEHYEDMIQWVPGAEDGRVIRADPTTRTLYTEFAEHTGAVVNLIPPQQAGVIAQRAGLTDESGWCPIDQRTFESTLQPGVHVIGDACIAGDMAKSAYSANSQAKVCAAAIAALINESPPPEPAFMNTCYTLITPEHGISMAAVYRLTEGKIVRVEAEHPVSAPAPTELDRELEARYARGWVKSIAADTFS